MCNLRSPQVICPNMGRTFCMKWINVHAKVIFLSNSNLKRLRFSVMKKFKNLVSGWAEICSLPSCVSTAQIKKEILSCIFILLSRESDQSAITSLLRSCRPSVYHSNMWELRQVLSKGISKLALHIFFWTLNVKPESWRISISKSSVWSDLESNPHA